MTTTQGSWNITKGFRDEAIKITLKSILKNDIVKRAHKIKGLLLMEGLLDRDNQGRSNYVVIDFPQAWGSENIEQYVSQYGTKLSDTRTFELVFKFGIINNSIASKYFSDSEKQLWFKELGNKWILILKDGLGIITTLLVFK
jgi:hypothetical protein